MGIGSALQRAGSKVRILAMRIGQDDPQGVDFLGWHLYLTDTGKVIKRLRTSNKKRFKKRMKCYQKRYAANNISFAEITRSIRSYNGHLQYGHTWKLRKHIYNYLVLTRGIKGDEHYEEKI